MHISLVGCPSDPFFLCPTNFTRLDGEPEQLELELSLVPVEPSGTVDEALPHAEQLAAQNVDWNILEISEIYDQYERRLEIIEDVQVFELLGLRDEEENEEKARKSARVADKAGD